MIRKSPLMFKYFRSIWGMFQTFCWNCLIETLSNNPFHKGIPNIQTSNLPLPGDSIRDLWKSPNVGLVTFRLLKGSFLNSPSQKRSQSQNCQGMNCFFTTYYPKKQNLERRPAVLSWGQGGGVMATNLSFSPPDNSRERPWSAETRA